jgi:hypothetical protein
MRHNKLTSKTPFYYQQSGNNIVILDRKTHIQICSYSKTNTKTNINIVKLDKKTHAQICNYSKTNIKTDIIRDKNLEVYFIHIYHKVIEEKEVTYKFICTLLLNY